jgi:hypothetical protein
MKIREERKKIAQRLQTQKQEVSRITNPQKVLKTQRRIQAKVRKRRKPMTLKKKAQRKKM